MILSDVFCLETLISRFLKENKGLFLYFQLLSEPNMALSGKA